MHISQFKTSKFLKKEDVGPGVLVTIDHIEQANVAMAGEPEDLKYVLIFEEDLKPMVLNTVNARLIALHLGSEETDDWHGQQITLYSDPSIMYGGKMIGGIRVRPKPSLTAQPKRPAVKPAASVPATAPVPAKTTVLPPPPLVEEEVGGDDDVPF
jgi:hypothetical protein